MLLQRAVERAIAKAVGGKEVALLYSGGVDSSLLLFVGSRYGEVVPYTFGTPDSKDLFFVKAVEDLLPVKPVYVIAEEGEVREVFGQLREAGFNRLEAELLTPLRFLVDVIREKEVLIGSATEELFAGYERHFRYLQKFKEKKAKELLKAEFRALFSGDLHLFSSFLASFGKEAVFPFAEPEVEVAAALINPVALFRNPKKAVLREVALKLGVPPELAWRKKLALQYSTGVHRVVRRC